MTIREMRAWFSATTLEDDREDGADRPPWLLSYAEDAEGGGRRMETKRISLEKGQGAWEPRTGGGKKNSRKMSHLHSPIDSSRSRRRFVRTGTGKPSEEETKCTARSERESVVHEVCSIGESQDAAQAYWRFKWVPAVPTQDNARSMRRAIDETLSAQQPVRLNNEKLDGVVGIHALSPLDGRKIVTSFPFASAPLDLKRTCPAHEPPPARPDDDARPPESGKPVLIPIGLGLELASPPGARIPVWHKAKTPAAPVPISGIRGAEEGAKTEPRGLMLACSWSDIEALAVCALISRAARVPIYLPALSRILAAAHMYSHLASPLAHVSTTRARSLAPEVCSLHPRPPASPPHPRPPKR
ncbi:hypothetical protein FB451DRAFT_1476354 [Mycena latifolia]|nr:hypothetical protein FB451DRAFT_1476354 [Mycena latifolia]